MTKRDVLRIERALLVLTRHPSWGTFSRRGDSTEHIERSAYLLMDHLENSDGMSIKELTDAFGLDTSTVNRHTNALLRAGLVERIPDPAGGIARKFRLAPAGVERLARYRNWIESGLSLVVRDWTDAEFEQLASSLEHLAATIEELRGLA